MRRSSSFPVGAFLSLLVAFGTGDIILRAAAPFQRIQEEEAVDYYRKWLEEDVVYIITGEERDVFRNLRADDERDRFIEQFWYRRDPDPATSFNEFKEEHYRRIQYANERFTAGVAGWRTDRGRVYIKFGPPDDIQDYPAGSTYVRANHEGGGTTLVNPFQVWRYNWIEGVGTNVEIEFVDPHGGNLYRFARDLQEKDALLFLPLGHTRAELMLGGDKTERIVTRQLGDVDEGMDGISGYAMRSADAPMERLIRQGAIEAAPAFDFTDLKKVVTTRVQFSNLGFQSDYSVFRVDGRRALVPVSVWVSDSELTFERLDSGVQRATVEVYGAVTSLGNHILQEFSEMLVRDKEGEVVAGGKSVAHKSLLLEPGRYKLSIVVRDVNSGKIGTADNSVVVPSAADTLSCSSLLLADGIALASGGETSGSLILGGKYRLLPKAERIVRRPRDLMFYLEFYGAARDQSTDRTYLHLDMRILRDGKPWPSSDEVVEQSSVSAELVGDRVVLAGKVPSTLLEPGLYRLEVFGRDEVNGAESVAGVDFQVEE
jgi:GWxTD domain-containing protein